MVQQSSSRFQVSVSYMLLVSPVIHRSHLGFFHRQPIQTGQWSWKGPNSSAPLSRTCCYNEIAFDVEITLQQISVLVEWDTDVNQWVCMARVRSGGWDVSSSLVKVVLEENKLYYIHLDVPENTPCARSFLRATARILGLLRGPSIHVAVENRLTHRD